MTKLSTELQRYFFEEERPSKVTLADILELSGGRTFGFLFVLLSVPSALPIPAPGYSIPFGLVMFVLAVQLAAGAKTPFLPAKLAKRPLELKTIQGFLDKGIPWFRRLETICRPRLSFVCTSFAGRVIIGVAIALMSVSMMIPIPGTNTLPAIGIFVTGFGLLDDDGAISIAGLAICFIGLTLSTSILIAVWFGGSSLLDLIKQLLG